MATCFAIALKLPGDLEGDQTASAQTAQQVRPLRLNLSNVADVKFRHLFESSVQDRMIRRCCRVEDHRRDARDPGACARLRYSIVSPSAS